MMETAGTFSTCYQHGGAAATAEGCSGDYWERMNRRMAVAVRECSTPSSRAIPLTLLTQPLPSSPSWVTMQQQHDWI